MVDLVDLGLALAAEGVSKVEIGRRLGMAPGECLSGAGGELSVSLAR
jgi:hypothetical protein